MMESSLYIDPEWYETLLKVEGEVEGRTQIKEIAKSRRPVLVIDYYHNLPGEVVTLDDLEKTLLEKNGIHRLILTEADNPKYHLPEIIRKLSDNIPLLGGWGLIFTRAEDYEHLPEFIDFLDCAGGKTRIVLV